MSGVAEEAGKVATSAVDAMKSSPLAIALLLVNIAFIGFNGWLLSAVANNASERNRSQMDLIAKLADDVRDCSRQRQSSANSITWPPLLKMVLGK